MQNFESRVLNFIEVNCGHKFCLWYGLHDLYFPIDTGKYLPVIDHYMYMYVALKTQRFLVVNVARTKEN